MRIDGPAIAWTGVVVIDHPNTPADHAVPAIESTIPVAVLLRRDWEFLFEQLRSTHAVVSYLARVGEPTEALGSEAERYYELAAADRAATPGEIHPALLGAGEPRSVPLLPTAPAGSDDDEAHGMVRMMLEDIANTVTEEDQYDALQKVLASLDSLPVGYRTELGRVLLDALVVARAAEPGPPLWQSRTFLAGADQDQLSFGVCSVFNETTNEYFLAWLQLRHHERCERLGTTDLTSIGVLLTPRNDGDREWDITMSGYHGDLELTDEELRQYRELSRPRL